MILKQVYDITIDYLKRKEEIEKNNPLMISKKLVIELKIEVNKKIDDIINKK